MVLSSPPGPLVDQLFRIERLFRERRVDVGGARVLSKTVLGSAAGVIPDLSTDTGEEWADMRERHFE